ncbi:MAG: hypothetical protein ACK5AV_05260 [Alphaproteobacteria bacterium]
MKAQQIEQSQLPEITEAYVEALNAVLGMVGDDQAKFSYVAQTESGYVQFLRNTTNDTPSKCSPAIFANDLIGYIINNNTTELESFLKNTNHCKKETGKKTIQASLIGTIKDDKNIYGCNALVAAIVNKNKVAALKIIDKLSDAKLGNSNMLLSLAIFCLANDSTVLNALIAKKFQLNLSNDPNPMYVAAKLGRIDVLEVLKNKFKSDTDIKPGQNTEVLKLAIEADHQEFVKKVIELGLVTSINKDDSGKSDFDTMIEKDWYDVIEFALTCTEFSKKHINLQDILTAENQKKYAEDTIASINELLTTFRHVYKEDEFHTPEESLSSSESEDENQNAKSKKMLNFYENTADNLFDETTPDDFNTAISNLKDLYQENGCTISLIKSLGQLRQRLNISISEAEEEARVMAEEEEEAEAKAKAEAEAKAQAEAKAAEAQRAAAEQPQPQPQPQPNPPVKKPSTAKCIISGGIFSALSSAVMYGIYTNQHVVLENAYFFAAQTALANNEYGNMLVSMITNHSQECALAFAALTVVVSFCAGYAISYKLSAKTEEIDVPGIV